MNTHPAQATNPAHRSIDVIPADDVRALSPR